MKYVNLTKCLLKRKIVKTSFTIVLNIVIEEKYKTSDYSFEC